MNKAWKIGTDINSYIDKWKELLDNGVLDFIVQHKDKKTILFTTDNGLKWEKSGSTASQFLRVLLSLGLIKPNKDHFEKDKSVLQDNTHYMLTQLNNIETVWDTIAVTLKIRTISVLGKDESLYPSDSKFIWSLMSVVFSNDDSKNEKYINLRLSGTKVSDIKKYYQGVASKLKSSIYYKALLNETKEYIIGFNSNTEKLFKSIKNDLSNDVEMMFAPKNLKEQIKPEAHTFGSFVKSYFTEKNHIAIPLYQRKYIWSEEMLKTLLNDILQRDTFSSHYIGNIIVKSIDENNKRVSRIIDGQQRLTTLTIILRAIFDYSKYMKAPVDTMTNGRFDPKDSNSIDNTFERIKGNNDFDAFHAVVSGDIFNKDLKSSKIIMHYQSALNWMSIHINTNELISRFWENLLNGITMVIINDKASNEYKLFEKLNTGSVPLTTIELFKNYILDKFSNNYGISEEDAQKEFDEKISSKFNPKSINKDIETFITTSLRKANSTMTDDTIFNQYKDYVQTEMIDNNPESMLNDILQIIGKEIEMYKEISTYHLYNNDDSFAYGYADFLYMFEGRTVYYPLILRLIEICITDYKNPKIAEVNDLRKYLRIIEIFEVRLQVAAYRGQSLSSKIEQILEHVNDKTTPSMLWKLFNDKSSTSTGMASIDLFKETLATQPISNKPAKLIMTRIENYFHLKDNWNISKDTKFTAMYQKPSQREHLLPQEWRYNWGEYLEKTEKLSGEELDEKIRKVINYIGNAFPIPAWSNKSVKNSSFEKKKKKFLNEPYSNHVIMFTGVDKKISAIENTFDSSIILKRSEEIAKVASEIWKDYE